MKPSRRRSGFTLVEIAVAAVILALLAAVTTPYLIGFIDKQRAQTTADKLAALATGIAAFNSAVHATATLTTTTMYPGRLSELTNVIVTNTTASHTSCGTATATLSTFTTTAVTSWNTSAPFVTFMITTNGVETPMGIIMDSIVRTSITNPPTPTTLQLKIIGADSTDAPLLDRIVDGGDGASAGVVQWVANANPALVDIKYFIPAGGKC
ncbi:MAG TPA: prepilin-type N-terminal cleavage/methylation domain-containing protein [Gemmatimonadaceae bacterium]|nr:prepilin-type N-terminal cleavage/methylation domain-containing protein [Gemmatimonadaceae bacterium]